MDNTETIPCFKCHGTGRIPVPRAIRLTLETVRDYPGLETSGLYERLAVGDDAGIRITAINNRLNALAALGMVRREGPGKNGNPYRWYPIKDPDRDAILAMSQEEIRQGLRDSGISDADMDKAKTEMHKRFRQIREAEGL